MDKLTIDSFEHIEPSSFFIAVHVQEDVNYVRDYAASIVLNTTLNGNPLTLSIGTGIIEDTLEACVKECTHHAIHLFRDFPQDAVLVIDVDGDIESEESLNDIFERSKREPI